MDDRLREFVESYEFKKLSAKIKEVLARQNKKVTSKMILEAFLQHLQEDSKHIR